MTRETLMEMKREQEGYEQWEREKKNEILRMTNTEKKMKAWQPFRQYQVTGEVLLGNIF
jgi:hypothetical protein